MANIKSSAKRVLVSRVRAERNKAGSERLKNCSLSARGADLLC